MQGELDTLTGILDRVGIWNNVGKIVGMFCCSYRAVVTQLEAAYEWRMKGGGGFPTGLVSRYRCSAWTAEQTWRQGCLWTTYRRSMELAWELSGIPPSAGEPQTYRISLPNAAGPWEYQVKGCKGRAAAITGLHVHFLHRHVLDTEVILEKGNPPTHSAPAVIRWFHEWT